MILRSATQATARHLMPALVSSPDTGSYRVKPLTLIDVARIELRWENVDSATRAVLDQHWRAYGAKGKPFLYEDVPAVTLPEGHYAYDEPLSIEHNGAGRITMRTAVRQTLTYD